MFVFVEITDADAKRPDRFGGMVPKHVPVFSTNQAIRTLGGDQAVVEKQLYRFTYLIMNSELALEILIYV